MVSKTISFCGTTKSLTHVVERQRAASGGSRTAYSGGNGTGCGQKECRGTGRYRILALAQPVHRVARA